MFERKISYGLYFTLLLILPLIFVYSGCLSKYRMFSNNEGIAHFSFEYPRDMKYSDVSRTDRFVDVYFRREIVKDGWFDKDLYVSINKPPGSDYIRIIDAKTLLEDYIIRLDEAFKVSRVLERSPVNINGIPGELLVTTWDMMSPRMPLPDGALEGTPQQASLMMIGRTAYFDQGGMVWKIQMESTEDVAEETKDDFDNILNTFKILD